MSFGAPSTERSGASKPCGPGPSFGTTNTRPSCSSRPAPSANDAPASAAGLGIASSCDGTAATAIRPGSGRTSSAYIAPATHIRCGSPSTRPPRHPFGATSTSRTRGCARRSDSIRETCIWTSGPIRTATNGIGKTRTSSSGSSSRAGCRARALPRSGRRVSALSHDCVDPTGSANGGDGAATQTGAPTLPQRWREYEP